MSYAPGRGLAGTERRGRAISFLRRSALAPLALACAVANAAAHDFWLEPSSFTPAPGSELAVAIRVGVPFSGDPLPRNERLIRRFVLLDRRGATPLAGKAGDDPAGRATLGEAGAALIGYIGAATPNVVDAETFEAYLRDKGLDDVLAARARAHTTREPGSELYSRCAKALVRVGGAGDAAIDQALGCRFELFAEKLAADGASVFRAHFDGKPAPGVKLTASNPDSPKPVEARTGSDGRAVLRFDRAGRWIVSAVHMTAAPPNSGVEWESVWASVAFAIKSSRNGMALSQRSNAAAANSLEQHYRLR